MFLQVTTLVEIVDHMGMTILPHALKPSNHEMPLGLTSLSTSKLQWPTVYLPSPTSWRLWNQTISNLFTSTPTGNKLDHPLGEWTEVYQAVRIQKWHLSPSGNLLYREDLMTTTCAAICTTTQCTKLTFTLTAPMNQPFNRPPVTPYDTHNWIMTLPVPALPPDRKPLSYLQHKTLTAQIRTMLAPWQVLLFGPRHWLQPNHLILDVSQDKDTILLISNASVQKSKQSSFAWTIMHDQIVLWQGVGLAPGNAANIYSGHAEAFGIIGRLTFSKLYMDSYEHALFHKSLLHCYCNNLGVITNVTKLLTPHIQCPNNTTTMTGTSIWQSVL